MRMLVCLAVLAGSLSWAADRPDLNGTWQISESQQGKLKFDTLSVRVSGDTIQLTEATTDGKNKVEFQCGVDGQECKTKESGGAVSFWYDGPALVMMEMRHNKSFVNQIKLQLSSDGKTLQMEITRINPPGSKPDVYSFTRVGS